MYMVFVMRDGETPTWAGSYNNHAEASVALNDWADANDETESDGHPRGFIVEALEVRYG